MSPSPPWRTAFVMTSLITRRRSAIRVAATNGAASSITRSRARGTECGSGTTWNVCLSIATGAGADRIGTQGYRSTRRPNTGGYRADRRRPAASGTDAILDGRSVRSPMTQHSDDDEPLGREVWIVAIVVTVGVIMSILDTTIVNVALETLSRELDASLNTIQWVSTGYMLALAAVIPLTGWMSERFGAKRVWMVSVALFGAGSALCGLAWSAESLIAFRVLQGIGGGMIMPVGMSVLAQTAGPHRVGRVMSVIGVPMLLGPIFGPVIGGLIVDSFSWRWIFYVNVPIAVLALVLAARLLHADAGRADAGRLDWLGLALLSPALAGIVFGLSEIETHGGIGATIAWGPIVAGLLLVAAFIWHAARAPRPLLDVRLFRVPAFG